MSPTPGPESRPDRPEPAQADTDAREILRDQMADAMRDTMVQTSTDAAAAGAVSLISWSQLADAVMPVVEATATAYRSEAIEQRQRAEQAEDRARTNLDAIAEVVLLADEQQQRAMAAEAKLAEMAGLGGEIAYERDQERARAEQAEAAVQRARDLAEAAEAQWRTLAPESVLAALDQPKE